MILRCVGLLSASVIVLLIEGCAIPERKVAVPSGQTTKAEVPGIPGIRYWSEIDSEPMAREGEKSARREKELLIRSGHRGPFPTAHFLALSGGGDNGAFGAGLLVGWTAAGNRPTFKAVTGISIGALIAPFAFLGPKYDDRLRAIFTTAGPKDIFEKRSILAAVFDDAMATNRPLQKLLERYANEKMLRDIAREYRKGRLLWIGTTNLDSRQPVIWNMGKLAASGHPKALKLFRSILLASAAIPGAFPPVMIEVEVHGKRYQEMHVDGGTMAQVVIYPPSIMLLKRSKAMGITRKRKLYLIRNARLDPSWVSVERRTLDIASRAIASLIHSQGIGDLYRIYLISQRDKIEYNLSYIPKSFTARHKEEFDTAYMRKLFALGYRMARDGYPWSKTPPGYVVLSQ